MWKLKIANGNKEEPYLFSTNNFLGRQTWEFDPDAGTLEERAAVEEARHKFFDDRFRVKASSDLLWRMQVFIYCYSFVNHILKSRVRMIGKPNTWKRICKCEINEL